MYLIDRRFNSDDTFRKLKFFLCTYINGKKKRRGESNLTITSKKKRRNTSVPASVAPTTTIATIPNSVLIGSVFPYLGTFNQTKNVAKTLQRTHGQQLQEKYVQTVKEPKDGCLEEIFRHYPFLPRITTEYIFVRPGIFDEFDQECLPRYPLQIGRCCFRIDYSKDVINQILPNTPMTTRKQVEKWIRIVDGVTKTFSNDNVPYLILHYFYNRSIDILSQSPTIFLTLDDMSKLLRYLKRHENLGVEDKKLGLVALMICRLGDSVMDRIHYVRDHWKDVMDLFYKYFQKRTQRDLYIAMLIFDPNFPLTPQEIIQWNTFVLSRMDIKPLHTRKMLFEKFKTSVRNAHNQWRESASFYVNDLLPILINKLPPRFDAGNMLFSLPPYPETVPLWIKLYQLFSKGLTNGKKKRIFTHYLQNIMQVITEEQHDEEVEDMDEIKRNRVLQLYQELKQHGIEKEILLPVLVHFFHRHQLLPGSVNRIKTRLLAMGL